MDIHVDPTCLKYSFSLLDSIIEEVLKGLFEKNILKIYFKKIIKSLDYIYQMHGHLLETTATSNENKIVFENMEINVSNYPTSIRISFHENNKLLELKIYDLLKLLFDREVLYLADKID